MRRWWILVSLPLIATGIHAQTAAINGFCTNGGKSAVVQGLSSTNKLNQIIPSCTVTVYITGTTTLAPAIYKDAINTPLSNPFTADSLTAVAPGKWLFFAPQNQGYDVVMSGGIAPLTFSAPVTLTDLIVGTGGGGGGGCTPIGLNGVLQASNGVGGCTAAYVQVDGINLVTPTAPNFVDTATVKVINPGTNQIGFNGVSSSPTIQHNDVTLAGNFSAGTSQILDFNDTTPTPPAGYVNAIFQPDTATGRLSAYVPSPAGTFEQQLPNPLGTQHVILYPTGVSTSTTGQPLPVAGLTSATLYMAPQCAGSRNGQVSWTFTGALAAQAPWVIPANVTAVYAFFTAGANVIGGNPIPSCLITPALVFGGTVTTLGVTATLHGNSPLVPYTGLTGLTGSNVNTATASAILSVSGNNVGHGTLNIANMGLVVYYTGTAPPPDNAIEIVPPLQYSTASGFPVLSLDNSFPTLANTYTVAALPPAATSSTQVAWVSDGVSATDCTTGGAAMGSGFTVMCAPTFSPPGYTGSWAWAAISGGGGGGSVSLTSPGGTLTLTPNPITGTGTMDVALGHANTWTATQTFSNVKDTGAAAGSATACLQIDTTGLISNTGTTCGGGGGGGSNVKVNGGTALTTVNLNSTTPAAGALNQNLALQVDGSGNTSVEVPYGSASNLGVVKVDGTTITASGGVISAPSNGPVCSGSITLTGATIPGSTAGTNQTVTCTGLLTTDNIMLDFNGSPLSTNGFVPASGGPITIVKYPSANTINVTPVNYNSSSVTLGSITLNYRVVRGGGGTGGSGGGTTITPALTSGSLQRAVISNVNLDADAFSTDGSMFYQAAVTIYPYSFAADTWYAIHGYPPAFSPIKLKNIVDKFIAAVSGTTLPIALQANTTAIYYSGCQADHTNPSLDGALYVPMLEYAYYQRTGDISDFATNAATMKAAINAISLDGTTHLVTIPAAHPYVAWPFHDGIVNTGLDLMGSLQLYQTATAMATMYTANSDATNATAMTLIATNIKNSLNTTGSPMWDGANGLYFAASINNNQDDILGSAFALYLGIPTGAMQTAISSYLVTNYTALTAGTGYIHQSPSNWANSVGGNQCTKGTGNYDDGRWSVGNEWVWTALNYTSQAQSLQFMVDFNANADPTQEYYGASLNGATSNLESPMGNAAIAYAVYPYMINLPTPYTGLELQTNGSTAVYAPFMIRDTQSGGGFWQEGPAVGGTGFAGGKAWSLYSGSNFNFTALLNGHFLTGTGTDCGKQLCVTGGESADNYTVAGAGAGTYVKADGTGAGTPGGSSGAMTNITGTVTATGCTVSGGACAVSGSTTTALTFSSIPGTYNSLQLRCFGRGDTSAANVAVNATFNGDTGANYWYVYSSASGTTTSLGAGSGGPFTSGFLLSLPANTTVPAASAGYVDMYIEGYANTTWNKAAQARGWAFVGTSATVGNGAQILTSWEWENTAAITSVTFTLAAGHYVAGSSCSIYGVL